MLEKAPPFSRPSHFKEKPSSRTGGVAELEVAVVVVAEDAAGVLARSFASYRIGVLLAGQAAVRNSTTSVSTPLIPDIMAFACSS